LTSDFSLARRNIAGILCVFQDVSTQSEEKDGGKMCAGIDSEVPQKKRRVLLMLTATAVKVPNIQDSFLTAARRSAAHVTVFLMNGYQMRGVISDFDPYVVVLMSENKQQVIYKHAISTITPERTIELD
jgi:host factor-I protein